MSDTYKVNIKWYHIATGGPIKEEAEYFDTFEEARELALSLHERYLADPKARAHDVLVFRIPTRGPSRCLLECNEDTKVPVTLRG